MVTQVAPRNPVSLTQQEAALKGGVYGPPAQPLVTLMAFSGDGRCMVTVDLRPDAGSNGSAEPSLKFWERSSAGSVAFSPFNLNSQANGPHRSLYCPAYCLAFRRKVKLFDQPRKTGACSTLRVSDSHRSSKLELKWRTKSYLRRSCMAAPPCPRGFVRAFCTVRLRTSIRMSCDYRPCRQDRK